MNRRAFLAGLLASTAVRPMLGTPGAYATVQCTAPSFPPMVASVPAGTFTASPITLAAIEELAAAIRRSFEPENHRRHMIASAAHAASPFPYA
jgi:hypothetical protein